jgi:hypothetical protein
MGIDSHLSTCVCTQSPKYLEMAQGLISLSHLRADAPVQGKRRKGKAHIVGWSKPTLLLISCSPKMLAKRLFHVIGQRRNPGHLLKRNGRTKWPKRRHDKHRMFILWDQGNFHPFNHRRYIILLKCGMARRWIHGIFIVHLSIRQWGTSILFILIHWSNGHGRERYNPKRPLYIGALLNDLHIKKPVTYIRFSSYAFGSSTFTKKQGAYVGHQKSLADGPALRPAGPRSGQSAVVARTVHACAESVRVPSLSRDLLPKNCGINSGNSLKRIQTSPFI